MSELNNQHIFHDPQHQLQPTLHYDPQRGYFYWDVNTGGWVQIPPAPMSEHPSRTIIVKQPKGCVDMILTTLLAGFVLFLVITACLMLFPK